MRETRKDLWGEAKILWQQGEKMLDNVSPEES